MNSIQLKHINEKIQGPFLAKIELTARAKQVDKCKQFLREYVESFAAKPGFIYDLFYFSKTIRELDLAEFLLNDVLKPLFEANRPPFASVKSIYICLSFFQFKRCFSSSQSDPEEAELLETMYLSALETYGRDMLPTAYQYADEFLILAVYSRLDNQPHNELLALRLINNLRQGLVNSPSNHHFKLLLINLYSYLGAYDVLQTTYDSMEIKNIQNYSISYLMFTQSIRLAIGSMASGPTVTAYQFFNSNLFDLANFLVNCFKYGTFVKLIEFIDFMDTVRSSFAFALCISVYASATILVGTEAEIISAISDDEMRSYLGQINLKLTKFVRENASTSRAFELALLFEDKERDALVDRNDREILYNWESLERKAKIDAAYHELIDEQCLLIKLRFLMIHFLAGIFSSTFNIKENK